MLSNRNEQNCISSWLSHFSINITNSAPSSRYLHNQKDDALLPNGNYWEPANAFSYSTQSRCSKWLDITVHTLLKNWKDLWSIAALIPWNDVQLHIVGILRVSMFKRRFSYEIEQNLKSYLKYSRDAPTGLSWKVNMINWWNPFVSKVF